MRRITLDGKLMTTRECTHHYLEAMLDLPEYYGKNLDALWDLLSFESRPTKIYVIHPQNIIRNLGDYGAELIEVLIEVDQEKGKVQVEFDWY